MNNTINSMSLVPQGSIEAYVQSVNQFSMLSAEEEKQLAEVGS